MLETKIQALTVSPENVRPLEKMSNSFFNEDLLLLAVKCSAAVIVIGVLFGTFYLGVKSFILK